MQVKIIHTIITMYIYIGWTQFGYNCIYMFLPKKKNMLSNVNPRNSVLQIFTIYMFLYIKCKSIRELVLVTNCIYHVLSACSDDRLVVNHLFIFWRILLGWEVPYVYRTNSALSLTIFGKSFTQSKKSSGPSIDPCGKLPYFCPVWIGVGEIII
jgi:hypothetical protein